MRDIISVSLISVTNKRDANYLDHFAQGAKEATGFVCQARKGGLLHEAGKKENFNEQEGSARLERGAW